MPAIIERIARVATENTMILDPSFAGAFCGSPRKIILKSLNKYSIVRTAPERNASVIYIFPPPTAPEKTMYFEKNPPNGGIPIIENEHTRKDNAVIGIVAASPPILVISFVFVFCSTIPAHKKSPPLASPVAEAEHL